MRQLNKVGFYIASLILAFHFVTGTEFTFDLDEKAEECFHEVIQKGQRCTLEFQVLIIYFDIYKSISKVQLILFELCF